MSQSDDRTYEQRVEAAITAWWSAKPPEQNWYAYREQMRAALAAAGLPELLERVGFAEAVVNSGTAGMMVSEARARVEKAERERAEALEREEAWHQYALVAEARAEKAEGTQDSNPSEET